ncbi:rhodanese-like domain-containing protein [Pseudonocardia sulfidoxydans]
MVATAHLADVDRVAQAYFGPDDTEEIGRSELLRRVADGQAVVLDVRPSLEFESGRIPGALSIPLDELADRLRELPTDQEIAACCRGSFCVLSYDAVRLLTSKGHRAVRLAEGFLEWRLAWMPVMSGAAQ